MNKLETNRKQRLRTLKKQIREGYETFYTTGMALIEIRETTLFLEDEQEYKTFEEFVKAEFQMSKRYAYYVIAAAQTRRLLPPPPRTNSYSGDWTEGTIRPLAKLNQKVAERVSRIAVQKVEKSYREAEKDPTVKPLRLTAALINQTIKDDQHPEPPKPKAKTELMRVEDEGLRIATRLEGIGEFIGKIPKDFWQTFKKNDAETWKRLRAAIARLDEVTK